MVKRLDLEEGDLYYEWEGDFIDFLENIQECREDKGYFEEFSDAEWIEALSNLEDSFVKPTK